MTKESSGKKSNLKVGDTAFIIESKIFISEVTITKITGGFVTVRFKDTNGAIKIRMSRVYDTREEVETMLLGSNKKIDSEVRAPRPPHRL